MKERRNNRIDIRLTDKEKSILVHMSHYKNMTVTDVIVELINKEHKALTDKELGKKWPIMVGQSPFIY